MRLPAGAEKPPVSSVKRPARPYESAKQDRCTAESATGTGPPRAVRARTDALELEAVGLEGLLERGDQQRRAPPALARARGAKPHLQRRHKGPLAGLKTPQENTSVDAPCFSKVWSAQCLTWPIVTRAHAPRHAITKAPPCASASRGASAAASPAPATPSAPPRAARTPAAAPCSSASA